MLSSPLANFGEWKPPKLPIKWQGDDLLTSLGSSVAYALRECLWDFVLNDKEQKEPIPPKECVYIYICIHFINFLHVRFGHLWSPKMDGDLTYCISYHWDNALTRLRGYVTLPLGSTKLRLIDKFASRCRLPVQRRLDLFARWPIKWESGNHNVSPRSNQWPYIP